MLSDSTSQYPKIQEISERVAVVTGLSACRSSLASALLISEGSVVD